MEDISFWLYIVFGLIYFIARAFKKKETKAPQNPGEQGHPRRQGRPKSFEELLQEFTEGKGQVNDEVREAEQDVEDFSEVRDLKRTDDVKRRVEEEVSDKSLFEEGTTRAFSDEESRRVYEESIKRAEGALTDYTSDREFRSKIRRKQEESLSEKDTSFASEIKRMLSNPEDAKKAVVLSEILNRKY